MAATKRQVEHRAAENGRRCSCGASFRKPADLRRHLGAARPSKGMKRGGAG